ncbi:hypothetical protein NBRC10512_002131 [Rhodotorula toruloides]|uniref:RHTO0S18e00782g1_1 n=2 Tax=Rhodotorula toruloides TaxID=5286 RepID=A0A061BN29_RHOTO|nr:uncharacterized protein RHTO_01863 [Rhodotorula toruloides NP11]EMS21397.1 hypothetical protein RHTO_01863 [Rhodotorula toruloides NP11]KAJ8291312.1 hypothetical protein OF846_005350 [Rhodotorula toruloides]CDR48471.1 RHTO0S18e00782g1_1 [Rhodotorula toruloides]
MDALRDALGSWRREPAHYLPLARSSNASTVFDFPPSSLDDPEKRQRRRSRSGSASAGLAAARRRSASLDDDSRDQSPSRLVDADPSSPVDHPHWSRRHRHVLAVVLAIAAFAGVYSLTTPEVLEKARTTVGKGWDRVTGGHFSSTASKESHYFPSSDELPPGASTWEPACSPSTWSSGNWTPLDPPLRPHTSIWDASPDFHAGACAQNWHRGAWYLGVVPPGTEPGVEGEAQADGQWPMSGYRRRAAGYRWQAGSETCQAEVEQPWLAREGDEEDEGTVKLLQDLVDRGAWLIYGDSLSEQQFFSLSCALYPHVRAVWPYPSMSEWRQVKEEHLFLLPDSPLVKSGKLRVPEDWDYDGSPLVSHVRTDHGLAPDELISLFETVHAKSAPRAFTALYPNLTSLPPFSPPEALLTDVETFSPSLDYTLQLFLRPSQYRNISTSISPSYAPSTTPPDALEIERQATRSGSYRALIFATGAHFSARHFNLPFKPEGGPNAQIEFFDLALRELLNRFARALESATEEERSGKEVVVRPTTMGHDDCHDAEGPLAEEDEKKSSWWSWPDMWRMNEHGANIVRDFNHPLITWLDISRPTNLRPDAHTNDDCLHLSAGTGVVEGWTHYMAYWLRERAAWLDQGR